MTQFAKIKSRSPTQGQRAFHLLKRIIGQMLLFTPPLLFGALLQHPRRAVDGGRNGRDGGTVHLHEHLRETTPWTTSGTPLAIGPGGGGGVGGRTGADPVVDKEGDVGVVDEVGGFLGVRVRGHDDDGARGEGGGALGKGVRGKVGEVLD